MPTHPSERPLERDDPSAWPAGDSQTARLVRSTDWAATPLGPIGRWPQSLRTVAGLVLASHHPMFVAWGPQRALLYNDAYAPLLGVRHPEAMGRPFDEVWSDILHLIGPILERAYTGESTCMDDMALAMRDRHGRPEEARFSFSYTPVRDERDEVAGMLCVCHETTEQHRVMAALRDSEERFRLAVESASLGTFWFDPLAVEWQWSPSLAGFYGFTGAQPLTTEQVFERVHLDDRERMQALLTQMLTPDGVDEYPYQHRIVRPDGELRHLDIRARVQFEPDASGAMRAVRVTGVVWDVTEHERLVESLRQADRAKDEFLAMLAHELRNPLAPLTNALLLMERTEPLTERGRRSLALAQRQTRQLQRLVDDLLEVSRITRGKIELRCEPMSVGAAAHAAVESIATMAEPRAQQIEIVLPARPVRIVADPARIEQVLENLLTNASKYTPVGGSIRLEVEDRADEVEIRVIDDGIGIEPAKIGRLFELFSQIDATIDRSQGGLGIGLALVKRLVELHGGRVSAASAGANRGATFTVRLPRGGPPGKACLKEA